MPSQRVRSLCVLLLLSTLTLSGCQVVTTSEPLGNPVRSLNLSGVWREPTEQYEISAERTKPGHYKARSYQLGDSEAHEQAREDLHFELTTKLASEMKLLFLRATPTNEKAPIVGDRWVFAAFVTQGQDENKPRAIVLWLPKHDAFRQACDQGVLTEPADEIDATVHLTSNRVTFTKFFESQTVETVFDTTDPLVLWRVEETNTVAD